MYLHAQNLSDWKTDIPFTTLHVCSIAYCVVKQLPISESSIIDLTENIRRFLNEQLDTQNVPLEKPAIALTSLSPTESNLNRNEYKKTNKRKRRSEMTPSRAQGIAKADASQHREAYSAAEI